MSRARQTATQVSAPPLPASTPGGAPPPPPPGDDSMDVTPQGVYQDGNCVNPVSGVDTSFQLMTLRHKDLACNALGMEMLTRKGIVLQYLNTNCTGATTMIGVTRIGLADPRKMPAYIERNLSIIRQHAVAALHHHFKSTLCSAGVLEVLSPEDFSISFSWASITEEGRSLTQHGKPDLALGYAVCDRLLKPILISRNDPHPVCVLNVFVQLQEPSRRSSAVLKKAREEEATKATAPKKAYVSKGPYQGPPRNDDKMAQAIAVKTSAILTENMKRSVPPSFDSDNYPSLPAGPAPEWNKTGVTSLPFE